MKTPKKTIDFNSSVERSDLNDPIEKKSLSNDEDEDEDDFDDTSLDDLGFDDMGTLDDDDDF